MRLVAMFVLAVLAVALSSPAIAQEAPAGANTQQQLLSEGELDALVAPIALYPDALLAQVLMASSYPLEVVQAERWAKANKSLKGDKLKEALASQDWDGSVKALVAMPTVLSMLNGDLDWLEKLGDAVLAQQADVMDAIQRLRSKAQANGKLTTTEQQKVTVTQEAEKQVIVIEPTSPETAYVPYYEPSVVYGTWPYDDYPPYYFPPAPGYIVGGALATGIAWGAAYAVGNAIWDNFDWGRGNINVDIDKNVNFNRHVDRNNVHVEHWQHNAHHRRGVGYNNNQVRNKFSNTNVRPGNRQLDFRGRNGQEVLKPANKPGGNLGEGKRPNSACWPRGEEAQCRQRSAAPRRWASKPRTPRAAPRRWTSQGWWPCASQRRWAPRRPSCKPSWRRRSSRWWRAPRWWASWRWWSWGWARWRTSVRHPPQGRHHATGTAQQWSRTLSFPLQGQRSHRLCGRHGAGGAED